MTVGLTLNYWNSKFEKGSLLWIASGNCKFIRPSVQSFIEWRAYVRNNLFFIRLLSSMLNLIMFMLIIYSAYQVLHVPVILSWRDHPAAWIYYWKCNELSALFLVIFQFSENRHLCQRRYNLCKLLMNRAPVRFLLMILLLNEIGSSLITADKMCH